MVDSTLMKNDAYVWENHTLLSLKTQFLWIFGVIIPKHYLKVFFHYKKAYDSLLLSRPIKADCVNKLLSNLLGVSVNCVR